MSLYRKIRKSKGKEAVHKTSIDITQVSAPLPNPASPEKLFSDFEVRFESKTVLQSANPGPIVGFSRPAHEPAADPESANRRCQLPAELQMLVMEAADWKQHSTLAQVCRFWRNFIKTSPVVLMNRYFPVNAMTEGYDGSPAEEQYPRPRPWVHRGLLYLRQFVAQTDQGEVKFVPQMLEVVGSPWSFGYTDSTTVCKRWPDMRWGFFKDDLVTVFPGTGPVNLKIAEREIVTRFVCCSSCEDRPDVGCQVFPLGPVAVLSNYLSFTTKLVHMEIENCRSRRKKERLEPARWDIVEFHMNREPILIFSPKGFDTDTLRLWFKVRANQCVIVDENFF
ncbi:hypothetical protein ABW19_dt0202821 [Dactylella cylindrospora]|nr:hypothetical protein ABW19_dt0202821 [Dactylella cylindrospora]